MKVGTAPRAVGDSAALNLREHAAQHGIIVADHNHAVERHAIHEIQKRPLHIAHVAIAVHVFAIDVGDDRENGRKLEERAVALIGFGHQILRFPQAGVGSHGVDAAANDYGGIEPASASTAATIEVVVVLPCIPAMAMPYFRRISSASISARWMTGMCRA